MEGVLRKLLLVVTGALAISLIVLAGPAAARDRNNDRIPDRWEKRHHLSLHKKQTRRDQDRDALVNRREWKAGLDPHDPDSDQDGVDDGDEGAGTISSFDTDTGTLTINLFHGGSVSGLVTGDTEIDCDHGDDHGDEDGDHNDVDDGDVDDVDDEGVDDSDDSEIDKSATASHDEPVDDEGDEGDDDTEGDDDQHQCSVDDLAVGAVVQEADLALVHGDAVFEEIELAA